MQTNQKRVLVVDDEPDIVSFVKEALEAEGYYVDSTFDGRDAIKKALQVQPDLILLDVMMPGADGYEVCRAIRHTVSCPIVFLSALDREDQRVRGLVAGGDDYMVKPFGVKELRARVQAHLRREERAREGQGKADAALYFGELVIDIKGRSVTFRRENIPFTHREFDLIELLALHPGRVFSREQIYDTVWGIDAVGDATTVTEHIKKIRAKMSMIAPEHSYIQTIWGVGYKWDVS